MDKRQKAIENILKHMREKRAGIAPDVLERAQQAALSKMEARKKPDAATVPYDKAAAQKAVALFLQDHPEQASFQKRLLAFLQGKSH